MHTKAHKEIRMGYQSVIKMPEENLSPEMTGSEREIRRQGVSFAVFLWSIRRMCKIDVLYRTKQAAGQLGVTNPRCSGKGRHGLHSYISNYQRHINPTSITSSETTSICYLQGRALLSLTVRSILLLKWPARTPRGRRGRRWWASRRRRR